MKLQAFLLVLAGSMLAGCGGGGGSSSASVGDTCTEFSGDNFNCQEMLQDIKAESLSKVSALDAALVILGAGVDAYCADTSNSTLQDTAKAEFKNTMELVQQIEVMQFGPIADVRSDFYVWPSNSLCRIDNQIATAPDADFTTIDSNARGLTAVEYLIFEDDVAAQCQGSLSIPVWYSDNSEAERKSARCDYAQRIVSDLEIKSAELKVSLTAYDFNAEFSNLQQAANTISDALFYVDTQTKDAKIKEPINLDVSNSGDVTFNTAQLESQFAKLSKENINNNLVGAKAIIQAGIDDYLIAKGQETLATNMISAIDSALINISEIDGDLNAALLSGDTSTNDCTNLGNSGIYTDSSSDLEVLCALQWNIKTFTDLLKQDFVLALNFSTPATADGDND
jgi:predicted lipoprotein